MSAGNRVLVVQSHRDPLPAAWYEPCVESVRGWTQLKKFEYRWLGDELFSGIAAELLRKTVHQPVVATDLGRLLVLEAALEEGFDRVVWVDADVLIVRADLLELPLSDALFGREVWVQSGDDGALQAYRKVHNAFMAFSAGSPVLSFYRYAAERILRRYRTDKGPMVAQLLGPKLLTLLHNAIGFDVLECAGMLSPLVAQDLLCGRGAALDLFLRRSEQPPYALNLSGSSIATGALDDAQLAAVLTTILQKPGLLGIS